MKILSTDECQRDLSALDAADQLEKQVQKELDCLTSMDVQTLTKKAGTMLLKGKPSLEGLGLSPHFFQNVAQLTKLNNVARGKLRARVTAELNGLQNIEEAEVSDGEIR